MFRIAFQDPRFIAWQSRLGRLPRWAWVAIAIGVLVPVVVLLASVLVLALLSGLAVLALVVALLLIRSLWTRLIGGFRRDDGRRNVRIVLRDHNGF